MTELQEKIASIYPEGDSGTPAFVVTFDPSIPVIGVPIVVQLHRIKVDTPYTLSFSITNDSGELVGGANQNVKIDSEAIKDDPAQLFPDNTVMVSVKTMIYPVNINVDGSENLKVSAVMFSDEMSTAPSHTYITTRPLPKK
ncbi:hypothetical protein [Weissella cibaria]|uniref:hypothetical protein n=1 Tax=Weissella cibaria TaxID=137591 RepID=UPI001369AF37|nr:hypothetical protein [Weissella cibaria]MYV35324.1 hypothetical protein [Weissella cibaria]